ncbi:MAG: SRPBCC domain-containing protein [Flavobacteriales bacterium]|nr:SRPBCC domain-containing protein [Flavobacteriales bacterium]
MEKETIIQRTLLIDASLEVVWKALTEPELARLYSSGWMAQSTWKRGAPIVWKERVEGELFHRAHGTIMTCIPEQRLRFTLWTVGSGLADEPANYTTIDISLFEERDGRTRLELWHGDYAGLPEDTKRAREAGKHWVEALVGLKRVSEEQQGQRAA